MGPILTGQFFCGRKLLQHGVFLYILPLIVIVAPQKLYGEETIRGQKIVMCLFGGPYMGGGAEIARPDNPAPCPLRWFRLPSVLRLDVEENDLTVRESVPTSTTAGAAIRTDVCDIGLWGGVSYGIFPR